MVRHHRALGLAVVTVAALAIVLTQSALAVHDLAFQLDGNVAATPTTNVGGSTQSVDWSSLFNADGSKKAFPSGFTASTFSKDFQTVTKRGQTIFSTADPTTYTTGSKDTLEINTGWQCSASNNLLSKNDIMNAYATAYTDPSSGHQILYFALERNSNNGDANVAFWFLQGDANCDASNGTASWTGTHSDGDLLIVSAFTNGGGVSTINAYRWNVVNGVGSLGTTPVAHGADCYATAGADTICATTNGGGAGAFNSDITTPWQTANTDTGLGNTLKPSEFFEGGIDLSANGLGNRCFNTFVGDTRSSQSLTATIFDYARGVLGECTSTTTTTPVDATDNTQPPASAIPVDPADAKVQVKDKTVVDATGISTFSGSISWHICGPSASNSTALCTTGGVNLGSQNITADGTYYSPTATVTAAGRYCFRAEFSGDSSAGVPGSSDSSANECFVVSPAQPSLTTNATAGPVDFGLPISDTVTLSGTAHKPGTGGPTGSALAGSINPTAFGGDATGSIVVKAYGPNDCSTLAFTSSAISAAGDGTYGGAGSAFEFTPTQPGQYVFVASYAGDSPNTLAISESACAAAPNAEKVTVRQIPTGIKTRQSWIPNDTATITSTAGNLAAGGTVQFSLYADSTCSGSAVYTESRTLAGGQPTEEVSTSNTGGANGYTITTGYNDAAASTKTYSWKVVYTPAAGDTAHLGIQSSCNAENFSTTYTNDPGPGTVVP